LPVPLTGVDDAHPARGFLLGRVGTVDAFRAVAATVRVVDVDRDVEELMN